MCDTERKLKRSVGEWISHFAFELKMALQAFFDALEDKGMVAHLPLSEKK